MRGEESEPIAKLGSGQPGSKKATIPWPRGGGKTEGGGGGPTREECRPLPPLAAIVSPDGAALAANFAPWSLPVCLPVLLPRLLAVTPVRAPALSRPYQEGMKYI